MKQIERGMYRAWSEDAEAAEAYFRQAAERREELIAEMRKARLSALSVFGGGGHWFLYAEMQENETFEPELLLPGADSVLSVWPGETRRRLFVPMADIFHYQRPIGEEHWRRIGNTESYGRIARLKPDRISSYVFYHYQYQEEKPGDGDKYGIIGLNENLLFFYAERPSTVELAPYEGTLTTRNTPEDWGAVMQPHFIEWPDKQENEKIWLNLKRAFDIRIPEA